MNKQKFVEYLRSPNDLDKDSMQELESLVDQYPYFQSARTLLAKAGKNLKSKHVKTYVTSAAVYATDRVLLKRYINDELIFLNPLTVHESHEADHERDLGQAIKTNRIASSQSKQESVKKEETVKAQKVAKSKKARSIPENYLKMDDLKETKPSDLDHMIDELYRDMEELKVNRARLKEIEDHLTEEEVVSEVLKKVTETQEPKVEEAKDESSDTEDIQPKKEKNTEPAEEETLSKEELKSESIKEESDNIETPESAESNTTKNDSDIDPEDEEDKVVIKKPAESRSARVSKINQEVEISKSLTGRSTPPKKSSSNETSKSKKQAEEASEASSDDDDSAPKKNDQDDIISAFIKNNPTISPAKPSGSSQNDLSGSSSDLHPDIASEYLAEIYLEQGHKERAIQIYEALIVRFPEKSLYFADIVKKLNEES